MADKIDPLVSDIPRLAALFATQRMLHPEGAQNMTNRDIRDFYEDCLVAANVMSEYAASDEFLEGIKDRVASLPSGHKD